MRKIFLTIILLFTILNGLSAQNFGEIWRLNKVEITETTPNGTIYQEILSMDTNALLGLIGAKEIIFLSSSQLNFKRIDGDDFETFSYTKRDKTLEIELSECLLKLDVEFKESEIQLSENKDIDANHTVVIRYSYTK